MKTFLRRAVSLLLIFSLLLTTSYLLPAATLAASSPFSQTDWSGGSGQTSWSDSTKFDSSSSVTTSVSGQTTLTATSSWCSNSYCDSNHKYRKKITFDNTTASLGVTSEALTNFPVLVKLSSSNIDYTKTQNSGQDIRFTDTDGTDLAYEIESWNESGSSFVWVKVPSIDINSNTDYIYLYYGNTSATDHQQATSAWDSNYAGVWHMSEDPSGGAPQMLDSTSNNNDATSAGTMTSGDQVAGQIDGSLDFDGSNDNVQINSVSLDYGTAFTVSVWFKTTLESWRWLVAKAGGSWLGVSNNGYFNWSRIGGDDYGSSKIVTDGVWHDGVVTFNNGALLLYVDGVQKGSWTGVTQTGTTGTTYIGSKTSEYFNGTIDEVRISNVARSTAWIAASYKSETDAFNTYASEEGYYNTTPGTLTSSIFDTEYSAGAAWGTLTYSATTPSNTSVSVKARTSNSSSMAGATDFSSCTAITSGSDISSNSCVTDSHRYIQYQFSLANTDSVSTPTFADVSIAFSAYDSTAPSISLTALSPDPSTDTTPTLSGTATEETGTVSNVQFQMDATSGSWSACSASDGGFDEATETFSCTVTTALSDGSHTMYVRATDSYSNTTSNASASTDTFTIDVTAPVSFDLDSPGHESYTSSQRPTFKWKATTDATSGLSSYTLEIDNGASGDFSITGIPTSRTTDYDVSKYLVHYENFSDSDSTNNYISIYTKSSSSWGSSENDGKLKEGSVGWKIKAIDAAGNERSEGRTLIVDLTSPTLSSLSSSDSAGSKDSYLLVTNQKPNLTGTITDNYSPDKVEISIYKENYFLGVITSKELVTSLTYSLSNGANNKSLSFSIPVPVSLDFGSYQVDIKGADKAGNKSSLSTIYLKVLTAQQAKELLQGKLSEEGKKTIQEQAQVSLPRLEEKAKERREKEAAELEKAMSPIAEQFRATVSVIASASEAISKQIEIATGYALAMTTQGIKIAVSTIGNGLLAMTQGVSHGLGTIGSGIIIAGNNFNQMVSKSQSVIASEAKQSLTGIESEIAASSGRAGLLAMTIGQGYNNLAHSAPGVAGTVLTGAGNGVNNIIRATARTYHKNIIVFKETSHFVRRIIEGVATGIYQTSGVLLTGVGQGFSNLDQTLKASQENTKQAINKSSQELSGNFSKGVSNLAFAVGERVQDVSDRAGFTIVKFGYLFVNEPTKIYDIQVATLSPTSVKISWKTNHPANGKVNWGLDRTYPFDVQTSKRTTHHEFTLTDLQPSTLYYFEVMSQNKNYVYDANREFKTPAK